MDAACQSGPHYRRCCITETSSSMDRRGADVSWMLVNYDFQCEVIVLTICRDLHHRANGPLQEHLRDLSSSLAAVAARSSPVGSKLLHLSLGLSPPPPEPPAGGGGGGGCTGRPGGTSGCPLFRPNSHDILVGINKVEFSR